MTLNEIWPMGNVDNSSYLNHNILNTFARKYFRAPHFVDIHNHKLSVGHFVLTENYPLKY